jgi:hypothetical protein
VYLQPLGIQIPFLMFSFAVLSLNNIISSIILDAIQRTTSAVGPFASLVIWNLFLFLSFVAVYLVGNTINHIPSPQLYDALAGPQNDIVHPVTSGSVEAKFEPAVSHAHVQPAPLYNGPYQGVPQQQMAGQFVPANPHQTVYTGANGWSQTTVGYQPVVHQQHQQQHMPVHQQELPA